MNTKKSKENPTEENIVNQTNIGSVTLTLKSSFDFANLENIQKFYVMISKDKASNIDKTRNTFTQQICRYSGDNNFTLDLFHENFEIFESFMLENNDTVFNLKKTFNITKSGLYSVYLGFCSTSNSYQPQKEIDFDFYLRIMEATIVFKNTDIGHLSAEQFLKLRLYQALLFFMIVFGIYWVYFAFRSYQYIHLYQLQLVILFSVNLIYLIFEYLQFENLNRKGELSILIEFGICTTLIIRTFIIFLFLMLLTSGYKINLSKLKTKQVINNNALLLGLFIINTLYIAMKEKGYYFTLAKHLTSFFLTFILISILYISYEQYVRTLQRLVNYREIYKIKILMRIKRIISFTIYLTLVFCASLIILKSQYSNHEVKERFWRFAWLKDLDGGSSGGFVDIVVALDIVFLMITMWPSEESRKFEHNPQMELECYEEERETEMNHSYVNNSSIEMQIINA